MSMGSARAVRFLYACLLLSGCAASTCTAGADCGKDGQEQDASTLLQGSVRVRDKGEKGAEETDASILVQERIKVSDASALLQGRVKFESAEAMEADKDDPADLPSGAGVDGAPPVPPKSLLSEDEADKDDPPDLPSGAGVDGAPPVPPKSLLSKDEAGCTDKIISWMDDAGQNCQQFAQASSGHCQKYGNEDFFGQGTANDVCCACGGGVKAAPACTDKYSSCPAWARYQYCKRYYVAFMTKNCPFSCKTCPATCDTFSCPSGFKAKPNAASITGATTPLCCDKATCDTFSCPCGFKAKPNAASITGATTPLCCDEDTCATYSCTTAHAIKTDGVDALTSPSESKCGCHVPFVHTAGEMWEKAWHANNGKIPLNPKFSVGDRLVIANSDARTCGNKWWGEEKTCTYCDDEDGINAELHGGGPVKVVEVFHNGRYAIDYEDGSTAYEMIDFGSSDSKCRGILFESADTQCPSDKYYIDTTGDPLNGVCFDQCPPGYNHRQVTGKGGLCVPCKGSTSRRRTTTIETDEKCFPCLKGQFPAANKDDCQTMGDTCDPELCEPCLTCMENMGSKLGSCPKEEQQASYSLMQTNADGGSCYNPGTMWCQDLFAESAKCQVKGGQGCFYKILCLADCVCDSWKTTFCGGKTEPAVTCPSSFLQALQNLNKSATLSGRGEQLVETGSLDDSLTGKRACR